MRINTFKKLLFFLFLSAISVLLGEAWKSLPLEEREAYSTKAKVLADEQKKIYPDCWKRKKTVATSTAVTGNNPLGENPATVKTTTTTAPMGGNPPMGGGSVGGGSVVAHTHPTRPLPLPPGIPRQPPPLEVAAQRIDSSSLDIV